MKTMQEILESTPTKEMITLKWEDENGVHTKKISEEQFRWVALNIAKGEFQYDKVSVASKKCTAHFDTYGRLTSPLEDSNCLSLNRDLTLDIFKEIVGPTVQRRGK